MTFTRLLRTWGVLALGIVLIALGFLSSANETWLYGWSGSASFGWFAYAPVSGDTFTPPPYVAMSIGSAAAVVVGIVLVAGWVGYRLGRRAQSLNVGSDL